MIKFSLGTRFLWNISSGFEPHGHSPQPVGLSDEYLTYESAIHSNQHMPCNASKSSFNLPEASIVIHSEYLLSKSKWLPEFAAQAFWDKWSIIPYHNIGFQLWRDPCRDAGDGNILLRSESWQKFGKRSWVR
jgi:hypothetical protein